MRLCVARVLDAAVTPVVVASGVAAIAIVLHRSALFGLLPAVLIIAAAALTGIGRVAWLVRAPRIPARREALQRIDHVLALHEQLSAAAEGAVRWPDFPAALPRIVEWRWRRIATPFALGAALLALAATLPVARTSLLATDLPTERPPVFAEAAELIEELRETEAAAPAAVDQLSQTLEELAARDDGGLYSHGTLEAAAHLRDQTAAGASELAAGLAAAEAAANQLADAASPSERDDAQKALDAALRALGDSPLPVNPALAGGFLHSSTNSKADAKQLADAARRLRNASGRGRGQGGSTTMSFGQRAGTPSRAAGWRPPSWEKENGNGSGDGANGEGHGSGSVARGPGHPPLALADTPAEGRDGQSEALESAEADQAALGEMLSESAGAPRTDLRRDAATGTGGTFHESTNHTDAARVDELSPAERRAVRRFFR